MKQFILITLTLLLFGCEEPKQVYETEIKTYVISHMETRYGGRGGHFYYIYFQTPTSTESARVSYDTYTKYKVGNKIDVLIKYWEKPKKK